MTNIFALVVFSLLSSSLGANGVSGSTPCWKNLTLWHDSFYSPGYPTMNYPPNLDCYWLIKVAAGNIIEVILNHLSVENSLVCQKDYLAFYDGPSIGFPLIHKRFCGVSLDVDQRSIISSGHVMLVRMHTDSVGQYRGFNASYRGSCHVNITSLDGVISSPDYPILYPGKITCNWMISRGHGYYTTIYLSDVLSHNRTDCESNYIQVQNGHNNESVILTICGEANTTKITTKGPMRILLVKGGNQAIGFKASYNTAIDIDECKDGTLEDPPCHQDARCLNNDGSFTCVCKEGYTGDGKSCSDIDECLIQSPITCHSNARCMNTNGSFICECLRGYRGNGRYCHDINECMERTHACRSGSICINKEGLYSCPCRDGFNYDRDTAKCLPDILVSNKPEQNNQALSSEVIGGIISMLVFFLAIIVGGFIYWRRKYRAQSAYGSEVQETTKYRNTTDNIFSTSQSYDFRNLSFASMESNHKSCPDVVASVGCLATFVDGEGGEDFCNDMMMHSINSTRLQPLDDQLESVEV